MIRNLLYMTALVVLMGCTQTVYMKHPATGKTVQCGPYRSTGIPAMAGAMREAQCIQDYKEQGYVRVPE